MNFIKAIFYSLLLLLTGCDGPEKSGEYEQNSATPNWENTLSLSLLSTNDRVEGIETTGKVFLKENFDNNFVLMNTLTVLNSQYEENFKFTILFKKDENFDELRLSSDEHFDNYFPYTAKNGFYTVEVTKKIIEYFDIDLLEKQRSIEFIAAGYKAQKKVTRNFYFTINFQPVFNGKITLSIKGLFHDPGDSFIVPRDQEYSGIIHELNLDGLKSGGYSEFSIYTLPDLNEKLFPYQKNRYDCFEIHEVRVMPATMNKYLEFEISNTRKFIKVKTKY